MKVYVVKHFWDEVTKGTKIEPKWILYSDKNLTKEEKDIKHLVMENLIKPIYYSKYSLEKPKMLKIEGYYIYFCYKTKPDPDPTNNRIVTDITFFISKKEIKDIDLCNIKIPDNYIIELKSKVFKNTILFIVFSFIFIFGFFMFFPKNNKNELAETKPQYKIQNTKKDTVSVIKENKIAKENENNKSKLYTNRDTKVIQTSKKTSNVKKQKNIITIFCNDKKIKDIIDSEKCYSEFIQQKCNKKLSASISFYEWLNGLREGIYNSKNPLCEFVAKEGKDKDLNHFYMQLDKKRKNMFKKFFKEF